MWRYLDAAEEEEEEVGDGEREYEKYEDARHEEQGEGET